MDKEVVWEILLRGSFGPSPRTPSTPLSSRSSRRLLSSILWRRTKASRRPVAGHEETRQHLIDTSQSIRSDPVLTTCVNREYLPSRWWHVMLTLAVIAVIGTATQLLRARSKDDLPVMAAGSVLVTAVCTATAGLVLFDSPYDRGHSTKRFLRSAILGLSAATSWFNYFQAAESFGEGAATTDGTDALLAAIAGIVLVLGLFVVLALVGMTFAAMARDTAIALLCGRVLAPLRRLLARWGAALCASPCQRRKHAQRVMPSRRIPARRRTSPPQTLLHHLSTIEAPHGAEPGTAVVVTVSASGAPVVANPMYALGASTFARRQTALIRIRKPRPSVGAYVSSEPVSDKGWR